MKAPDLTAAALASLAALILALPSLAGLVFAPLDAWAIVAAHATVNALVERAHDAGGKASPEIMVRLASVEFIAWRYWKESGGLGPEALEEIADAFDLDTFLRAADAPHRAALASWILGGVK